MSTQVKSIAALAAAFFLVALIGFAGTTAAFADEGAITAGAIAADQPAEQHADGWDKDGASWRYWQGGQEVKGQWIATSVAPAIEGIPSGKQEVKVQWIATSVAPAIEGFPSGKQRYWIAQDGTLAQSRLINPDSANDEGAGYFAYATKRGYVATGKAVVGDHVYLAKKNGALESGDSKGFLTTKKYDGSKQRYRIDPKEHAAITGRVVKVSGFGSTYSLPKKGYLVRGVTRFGKSHVLLADSDGRLCQRSGWFTTSKYAGSKQRYYLQRTTKNKKVYGARTGLFKKSGKKYLAQSNGAVVRNAYKMIGTTYYRADSKGALTRNAVLTHMYKKAQGYSSPSRYLILVDVNDTKFMVFTGHRGNWKVKYIWDCSTGHPSTPTPIGVWHVGIKGYSFGHGYTCYYYTQFWGDYLIHTRIYQEGTHILRDAAMNTQVSQGCVRLYDENAYWVYKNIPEGTTVVTIP